METAAVDYKALLLSLLGLPAEATDEEITSAQENRGAEAPPTLPADTSALDAQVADLQSQLATAQARVTEFETESNARREGETNALLEEYEGLSDDAKTTLREILMSDRAKGETLLGALPKKKPVEPAAPKEESAKSTEKDGTAAVPPSPKHDPSVTASAATEEEKAQKISVRAREIVKASGNKVSLTKAYQQAETELENAA